jgi:hypothetical protein
MDEIAQKHQRPALRESWALSCLDLVEDIGVEPMTLSLQS